MEIRRTRLRLIRWSEGPDAYVCRELTASVFGVLAIAKEGSFSETKALSRTCVCFRMAFVSPVFVRTVQTSSFGGASTALVRASPASKRKCPLVRSDRFSSLAMASDPPLRMEDVCFVGRKRDPKTGNISGRVYVVGDNIDTDVSFSANCGEFPKVTRAHQ